MPAVPKRFQIIGKRSSSEPSTSPLFYEYGLNGHCLICVLVVLYGIFLLNFFLFFYICSCNIIGLQKTVLNSRNASPLNIINNYVTGSCLMLFPLPTHTKKPRKSKKFLARARFNFQIYIFGWFQGTLATQYRKPKKFLAGIRFNCQMLIFGWFYGILATQKSQNLEKISRSREI